MNSPSGSDGIRGPGRTEAPGALIAAMERARVRTLELVRSVAPDLHAVSPGPDRWSVLQVIDHLQKTDEGLAIVLPRLARRATAPAPALVPLARDFQAISEEMLYRSTFSRFEPRIDVPPEVIDEAAAVRERLMAAARAAAAVDCGDGTYPHPLLGPLSAWDWMAFSAAHEESHHLQLEAIVRDLAG